MSQQTTPSQRLFLPGPVEDFTPDPNSPYSQFDLIKLSDIVTCLKWSHGSSVVQGRVYSIDRSDEYPFAVQIYAENSWILGVGFKLGEVNLIYCKLGQLRVNEPQQWNVEALWQRMFKEMSHSLRSPDLTKVDITLCAHKGCTDKSVQWILFNFVGTVYQVYVCQEHTKLHGMCSEDFPFESRQLHSEAVTT